MARRASLLALSFTLLTSFGFAQFMTVPSVRPRDSRFTPRLADGNASRCSEVHRFVVLHGPACCLQQLVDLLPRPLFRSQTLHHASILVTPPVANKPA